MTTTPATAEYVGKRRAAAPRPITILGREPAAWVGLIEAALALLVLLPFAQRFGLTPEWGVLVMAVVSAAAGVYTAWATKDTALGAILGLVKAGIGLAAFYQLELDPGQQAAVVAFTAVVVGFFQRTQTTPVAFPVDPSPPQVVNLAAVPDTDAIDVHPLEEGEVPQIDSSGVRWTPASGC